MNIILSNSSVNNGNRGCVALSLSIMYLIDKLLNKSNIPHVFYLPDSGFRLTENHTFHCGGVELKYKSCQNISFYNKRNALENMIRPRQYFSSRKIYKDADFILDIGQGDSFAEKSGLSGFIQNTNWQKSLISRFVFYHKRLAHLTMRVFVKRQWAPFEVQNV